MTDQETVPRNAKNPAVFFMMPIPFESSDDWNWCIIYFAEEKYNMKKGFSAINASGSGGNAAGGVYSCPVISMNGDGPPAKFPVSNSRSSFPSSVRRMGSRSLRSPLNPRT